MHSTILRNPIFRLLPLGPLAELLAQGREQSFAPGQALVRQGEPNRDLYILEAGMVHAIRDNSLVAERGEGEIIWEASDMGTGLATSDVIANDAVRITALPIALIVDLGQRYPAFADGLGTRAATRKG